jgi:hypothetical protein
MLYFNEPIYFQFYQPLIIIEIPFSSALDNLRNDIFVGLLLSSCTFVIFERWNLSNLVSCLPLRSITINENRFSDREMNVLFGK